MSRGTLEMILNRADDGLTLKDRRGLKLVGRPVATRRFLKAVVADAIDEYRVTEPAAPAFAGYSEEEEDSDTPFLDFLRELIASGKIQAFMSWLFEALPKLIAAIVAIFAVV